MLSTSISTLIPKYQVLLFDAFGVLVNQEKALEHAVGLIDHLNQIQKNYFVVTNDASKSLESSYQSFQKKGFSIPKERIISSGSLLYSQAVLPMIQGKRCVVLGPKDPQQAILEAGGLLVGFEKAQEIDTCIIADEMGFPFLEGIEKVLSLLFYNLDRGKEVHLLVPNPDLFYHKNEWEYGIASGSLAQLLEKALCRRYNRKIEFIRLGKPFAPIFEEVFRRTQTKQMLMIGDQLQTDILGAQQFGISSALVKQGVTFVNEDTLFENIQPTYLLESLERK